MAPLPVHGKEWRLSSGNPRSCCYCAGVEDEEAEESTSTEARTNDRKKVSTSSWFSMTLTADMSLKRTVFSLEPRIKVSISPSQHLTVGLTYVVQGALANVRSIECK